MVKKRELLLITFFLLNLMAFSGCTNNNETNYPGFKVYSWSSSLGSVNNENPYLTSYIYDISITNESLENTRIISIEPILSDAVKERLLDKSITVDVNEEVYPHETISVKGSLILNTEGMTKDEISKLNPFIIGIKINSETVVYLEKK
mgnify:FL=1